MLIIVSSLMFKVFPGALEEENMVFPSIKLKYGEPWSSYKKMWQLLIPFIAVASSFPLSAQDNLSRFSFVICWPWDSYGSKLTWRSWVKSLQFTPVSDRLAREINFPFSALLRNKPQSAGTFELKPVLDVRVFSFFVRNWRVKRVVGAIKSRKRPIILVLHFH